MVCVVELTQAEMRVSMEMDKERALASLTKELEAKKNAAVEAAKKKQWVSIE